MINNSFAVLAAVLMGLSSLTAAFELLIAGRFIAGINAGDINYINYRGDERELVQFIQQ